MKWEGDQWSQAVKGKPFRERQISSAIHYRSIAGISDFIDPIRGFDPREILYETVDQGLKRVLLVGKGEKLVALNCLQDAGCSRFADSCLRGIKGWISVTRLQKNDQQGEKNSYDIPALKHKQS